MLLADVWQSAIRPYCLAAAVSPGVPSTFHANYETALKFLTAVEGHCSTPAAVLAFRGCAAHDSFMRRWKLSIYFSTRFQVLFLSAWSLDPELLIVLENDQ